MRKREVDEVSGCDRHEATKLAKLTGLTQKSRDNERSNLIKVRMQESVRTLLLLSRDCCDLVYPSIVAVKPRCCSPEDKPIP